MKKYFFSFPKIFGRGKSFIKYRSNFRTVPFRRFMLSLFQLRLDTIVIVLYNVGLFGHGIINKGKCARSFKIQWVFVWVLLGTISCSILNVI